MAINNIKNFLEEDNPQLYNFELECGVEEYAGLSAFERWITYRATSPDARDSIYPSGKKFALEVSKKYPALADCDGSQNDGNNSLIHEVYRTLFAWEKGVGTFGCLFGGETMNSVCIPLKDHAGIKDTVNQLIDRFAREETRGELIDELKRVDGLEDYFSAYHTIGNFTLVPKGFNSFRGLSLNDYWDRSLDYLRRNGFEQAGFDRKDYTKYVNYFFLWDSVGNGEKPFFPEKTRIIYRRGIFMTAMLKLYMMIGNDKYGKLRESVFGKADSVYGSYSEVIDALREHMEGNVKAIELLEACRGQLQ